MLWSHEIGKAAGELWRYLDKNGPTPPEKVKKAMKITSSELFQNAVGWLARENKVELKETTQGAVLAKKD
ncbi:MAG: winged helix-turn-helix domain-containing protein [Planctomycetes bacterium]|nr:winged helix-turn-helix domain-containing protein [Planctomycetota bacterium]